MAHQPLRMPGPQRRKCQAQCWRLLPQLMALLLLPLPFLPAAAHEYWLDPERPVAGARTPLRANARVGQFFIGEALPWLPDAVARLGIVDGKGQRIPQRIPGDMPMFDDAVRQPGLQILYLETHPERLRWETWEKFIGFLREKRLENLAEEHKRRGLPEKGFVELYVRHAKALLWRGKEPQPDTGSAARDHAVGLRLELVMLDDPFHPSASSAGKVRVQLLWQGKPLPDADVQLFSRPAGQRQQESMPRHFTTDANGIAVVPVRSGHDHLLNAVIMLPLKPSEKAADNAHGAVWISHWASLTFTTPSR